MNDVKRAGTAALVLSGLIAGASLAEDADMILHGGQVLVVDRNFSIHSALAVKDGRVAAVGGPEILDTYESDVTIDLDGRTLMPGFIDTHIHIFAPSPRDVDGASAASIADLQAMVAEKAAELGPGEWVTGYGWDEQLMAEGRNPTRHDLDEAAPDNPVALTRAGGHSVVGNSLALEIAGVTADTPDPESGLIERGEDGEPNGIIRERNDLLLDHVPPPTPEQMRPGYIASLEALPPLGITSIMDAFTSIDDEPVGQGGVESPTQTRTYRMWRSIYEEMGDELPRATLYIGYPGEERLRAFPYSTGHGDDRLKLGPIGETPYDGGFTGPTALTKEDYHGQPGFKGAAFMSRDEARDMVEVAAELGWQLGIHAIGDAAIETMAEVYAEVLEEHPREDHRWFLSHFTMLPSEETMDLMADTGIWAAAQPNFLYNLAGRYKDTLDGYRLRHINPVAAPLDHDVRVAFGSDNLPIGPMVGLYAATTRKIPGGEVLGIEEAVSRQTAIELYTREAAYLTFDEDEKGTLEPGKLADMVVLSADPLTVPDDMLLNISVDLTIIGGRIVYDREAAEER